MADNYGTLFLEVSAKYGTNVEETFMLLTQQMKANAEMAKTIQRSDDDNKRDRNSISLR